MKLSPYIAKATRYAHLVPWYGWALTAGVTIGLLASRKAHAATGSDTTGTPPTGPVQPSGKPPTLKKGASGPWVVFLQQKLGIEASGQFDDATDAAVREYQGKHNLTVDGIVGKNTWSSLGVTIVAGPSAPPKGKTPDFLGSSDIFALSDSIPEREQQIIEHVQAGHIDHQLWPISWIKNGRNVTISISRRALALSMGDSRLIVNTTYPTHQKICDILGLAMLTTKMGDEISLQATQKLPVMSRPITSTTAAMYDQSAKIDNQISGVGGMGLIANEGKDWVITRRFWLPPQGTGTPDKIHHSANFGWYPGGSKSPGGLSVIQSVGLAHDMGHTDYSQLLRFCQPWCSIDGQEHELADALADPDLSELLQDEGGTLPGIRHPDL